jgi:hypothetical protein
MPFKQTTLYLNQLNLTTMIIVVNHKISNPGNFWASAQESLPKLPEEGVTRVLQVMPDANNDRSNLCMGSRQY